MKDDRIVKNKPIKGVVLVGIRRADGEIRDHTGVGGITVTLDKNVGEQTVLVESSIDSPEDASLMLKMLLQWAQEKGFLGIALKQFFQDQGGAVTIPIQARPQATIPLGTSMQEDPHAKIIQSMIEIVLLLKRMEKQIQHTDTLLPETINTLLQSIEKMI